MIDLTGHRVLVTGGSRGIGAACCRAFAAAGASVFVHYRTAAAEAERVLAELPPPSGAAHAVAGADLAEASGAESLAAQVRAEWGGLDCLINNAGIWVENPLAHLNGKRFESTWRINVRGPFLLASRLLDLLRASDDGSIVNITSTAGQRGEARYSPYAASKGAMIAATKSWAGELAPDVRVNSVAPGWVDTEMSEPAYADGGRERIAAGIPLARIARPADIAAPVVFLASSGARHITGEILNVNGGAVLCG